MKPSPFCLRQGLLLAWSFMIRLGHIAREHQGSTCPSFSSTGIIITLPPHLDLSKLCVWGLTLRSSSSIHFIFPSAYGMFCLHVCLYHVHAEARKGPGIKPRSSGRAANSWAISCYCGVIVRCPAVEMSGSHSVQDEHHVPSVPGLPLTVSPPWSWALWSLHRSCGGNSSWQRLRPTGRRGRRTVKKRERKAGPGLLGRRWWTSYRALSPTTSPTGPGKCLCSSPCLLLRGIERTCQPEPFWLI